MSNWLAGKGRESLHQIWAEFVSEHDSAATKAWHEVDVGFSECAGDTEAAQEAEYLRRLICCGWKHLAEEQSL